MTLSVVLITLGCPKNIVEGERLAGIIQAQGLTLTTDVNHADCAVVHTCSFIGDARRESSRVIRSLMRLKNAGRLQKVYVTGCYVQDEGPAIARLFPGVDGFLGTGTLAKLGEAIVSGGGFLAGPPGGLLDSAAPRLLSSTLPSAYLRIAEGCNHRCSFCTIPRFRGRYKSRPLSAIVTEAQALVDAGIRELILVAQDITAYGRDRSGRLQLPLVVRKLARIDGLRWIRLLYAYPSTVTDELLAVMRDEEKVCRYLDMPLQHASPSVLRRMRRPALVRPLLERITARVPGIALRTTFIVGFPSESAADFAQLRDLVAEGWFEHAGVFAYSDQPRAASSAFSGVVPSAVAAARRKELMGVQRRVVRTRAAARIGTVEELLVEGNQQIRYNTKNSVVVGRTRFQAPEIDSVVHARGTAPAGSFVSVRITGSRGYDLLGTIIGNHQHGINEPGK